MSTSLASNLELELAKQFIENTGKNLFLTGKAGTGKTTFLKSLRAISPKRMAVVAPTGVAAINAGGVTIHSFFQLPFGPQIPNHYLPKENQAPQRDFRFGREKLNILRSLDLLVIDEISMVRADMLDAIDGVLRRYRNRSKPFGGVQVLMIGDLQQLAPVVKESDWQLLQAYYSGPFFFQSKVLEFFPVETIELKHIYRQTDDTFIQVLNQIRENQLTSEGLQILQNRHIPNYVPPKGCITLTSHNRQADLINQQKMDDLNTKSAYFSATVEGDFPEMAYPNDAQLNVKVGAQVMFIKNDNSPSKLYFNGKIGIVENILKDAVVVRCDDLDQSITVSAVEWVNYKYTLNETTQQIEETPVGKFIQIPLKLAWAITIHKSQGLTFDHAIIDANAAFTHGQVYVALSRCRSLEGMVLSSPINQASIISNSDVNGFIRQAEAHPPTPEKLLTFQLEYEQELITELFNFGRMRAQLGRLKMEVDDNKSSVLGNGTKKLNELLPQLDKKVIEISANFQHQLRKLFSEQKVVALHPHLQERITKGTAYFMEQFNKLMPLQNDELLFELESDNKAIQKSIDDHLDRINKSYTTHLHCLEACSQGFFIATYLEAKSVSMIEKEKKKVKAPKSTSYATSVNPDLYTILRSWRNSRAAEQNWPVYMIVATKTLVDISDKMPSSIKELLKIKGFGKRKAEQFGKEILTIIQEYKIDNKLGVAQLDFSQEPEKAKVSKQPTWMITLELFKTGLTIAEIAKERSLVESTIESHLAQAIGMGELTVEKVLAPDRIKVITKKLDGKKVSSLTYAKNLVGNDVSFGELKMVMASLQTINSL